MIYIENEALMDLHKQPRQTMKALNKFETTNWNLLKKPGWELKNIAITENFKQLIDQVDHSDISETPQRIETAKNIRDTMIEFLRGPEYLPYGSTDSDVEIAIIESLYQAFSVDILQYYKS